MMLLGAEVAHIVAFRDLVFPVRYADIEKGLRVYPLQGMNVRTDIHYLISDKSGPMEQFQKVGQYTIFNQDKVMEAYGTWPEFENLKSIEPYFQHFRINGFGLRYCLNSFDGTTVYALTTISYLYLLDRE